MSDSLTSNPIYTFKEYTVTQKPPFKIVVRNFWGWLCPHCGATLKGNNDPHGTYWYRSNILIRSCYKDRKEKKRMQNDLSFPYTTRKQAKDSYHHHTLVCQGVPGQS